MIPKFRVWDKTENKMWNVETIYIEDEWVKVNDGSIYGITKDLVRDYVLMQSTGLKDITGDEIYEGDIVKVLVHDIEPKIMKDKMYIGVVAYNQGTFDIKISKDTYLGIIPEMYMLDIDCVFRILGNIYENPELLEDE
ncbi:YopX family protein [Staphylococcus hominis]|uniref:YopX family protein n=1 Tax=Staphylococcus hominis TaxID=1290 RepID=UPI002556B50E|nr:YopX family protein [Staphylococcus hominis]MDK7928867.1 YopX family protein [Staphylococcus hominis]